MGVERLAEEERLALESHLESCAECRTYAQRVQSLETELQAVFHARWDPVAVPTLDRRVKSGRQLKALPALAVTGLALVLILAAILRSPLTELLSGGSKPATAEAEVSQLDPTQTSQAVAIPITATVEGEHLIVFVSIRDGNREIYVVPVNGVNPVNLTQDPAQDYAPVWSPDGRSIAFVSDRSGQPELYVMLMDGTQVTRLSAVPGARAYGEPSWSPDGRNLAVQLILDYPYTEEPYTQIYLVAANGSGAVAMTETEFPLSNLEPKWSPVGNRIASRTLGIVQAFPPGASYQVEPEQIRLSRGLANVGTLAWSPDGSQLAYFASCQYCVEGRELTPAVYLIQADGENQQVLYAFADQELYGVGLSWSPIGDQMLLLATEMKSGVQYLYLIDVDGAQVTQLAELPAGAMESVPSWSPDGRQLVYALEENGESGIYVLDLDDRLRGNPASGLTRLTASRQGDSAPRWQP